MSRSAVDQANSKSAAAFDPTPQPGDPKYGAFRQHWMDAYIEAGGQYEQVNGEQQRLRIQQARKEAEKHTGFRGAVTPCPDTAGVKKKDAGGGAAARAPAPKQQPPKACDCRLTSLEVTCSHKGRKARNGLLAVVSDHALGDLITAAPKAQGNCATKLVVRADGKEGFPKTGTQPSSFRASELPLDIGPLGFATGLVTMRNAAPLVTMVTAEADGGTEVVCVKAYPSKKLSFKIDVKELREKYMGILAYLPIDLSAPRLPLRPLGAPKDPNWEVKKFGQTISVESQWAEEESTNLAYCETTLNGGFDPLVGTSASYPLVGIPVPPSLAKYIKAGVYFNVDFAVAVGASCAWAYWPEDNETRWRAFKIEGSVGGSGEFAAELLVLSPDAVQAKAFGKTQAGGKVWGEKARGEAPVIAANMEWKPLTVGVVIKLAWGLFEVERSWPIFKPIKSADLKHEF